MSYSGVAACAAPIDCYSRQIKTGDIMIRKTFASLVLGIAGFVLVAPAVLAEMAKTGVTIQVSDDSQKTCRPQI